MGKRRAVQTKTKEQELIAALANPLRCKILKRMANQKPISPRELASEFHISVSNMAYHVRVLLDCDAIKLVRVKPVRGATQHFYRRSLETDWARAIVDGDQTGNRGEGTNGRHA